MEQQPKRFVEVLNRPEVEHSSKMAVERSAQLEVAVKIRRQVKEPDMVSSNIQLSRHERTWKSLF